MTLEQISALGRKLSLFLTLFADCFGRRAGRDLLQVYVRGRDSRRLPRLGATTENSARRPRKHGPWASQGVSAAGCGLPLPAEQVDRLTIEQARGAMNIWLDAADLPPSARHRRYAAELDKQQYYQRRNKQARQSHTKTRNARLQVLGIDIAHIKSCLPDTTEP